MSQSYSKNYRVAAFSYVIDAFLDAIVLLIYFLKLLQYITSCRVVIHGLWIFLGVLASSLAKKILVCLWIVSFFKESAIYIKSIFVYIEYVSAIRKHNA